MRAYVVGVGVVSSLGTGLEPSMDALGRGLRALTPLELFDFPHTPLPLVGAVRDEPKLGPLPRTHRLALRAAREAARGVVPDAVILGTTTGGIDVTEEGLKRQVTERQHYAHHGASTVTETVARALGCSGPVVTVATACSSGAVALAIALGLLRSGRLETALAGGADGLCRLTVHGFNLLQLVDPEGARPLDVRRAGISLGEGAGFLLLQAGEKPPAGALAELSGAGLSCDAFHPTKPFPSGERAAWAIRWALEQAGIEDPHRIDYVNLHGTGTVDNDAAEARAVLSVLPPNTPVSSSKGAIGHTLGASGAIEAALAVGAIRRGVLLPNVGLRELDPALGLDPCHESRRAPVRVVVSNSFGFGGNNASLVLCATEAAPRPAPLAAHSGFTVLGAACASGAGGTEATLQAMAEGRNVAGRVPAEVVDGTLSFAVRRRQKRLGRLVCSLSQEIRARAPEAARVRSVAFGTAWGSLEETYDFLNELFTTGERFASPGAFVGSVHNAPAGQVAQALEIWGPNITVTSGDVSFETAAWVTSALLEERDWPLVLLGVDEHHDLMSPLLEGRAEPAEGGAAFLLGPPGQDGVKLVPLPTRLITSGQDWVDELVSTLGGPPALGRFGAVLMRVHEGSFEAMLGALRPRFPSGVAWVDSGKLTGDFAAAGALTTALAVRSTKQLELSAAITGGAPVRLGDRSLLLITISRSVALLEVRR